MGRDPWQWVLQFKATAGPTSTLSVQPISGWASLIATNVNRFEDILRLIRAHASTLRQVAFMREHFASHIYSIADVQGSLIHMAQLRSLTCWTACHDAPPPMLHASAFLLRVIHAPKLQELCYGNVLLRHNFDECPKMLFA